MHRLLYLFLSLVILAFHTIGSADPATFQPPGTEPFDDVDDTELQAEVTRQAVVFLDTLHRHWGDAPERVRRAVEGKIERDEPDRLIYLRNIHDHGVLEGYEFRQESLVRGQFIVLQRPLYGLNEFIGYYTSLKQALNAVYGEPKVDQIIWNNDLYQPLPDYWGVAVMIGHLHYYAGWDTADGTITLELTGNRHSKLLLEFKSAHEAAQT